jgi:hypothetical protein
MLRWRSPRDVFEDRIAAEKTRLEEQAKLLPHGPTKDVLLGKISQLETASHMHKWLSSPGLRPPK